jgi:hypothetical protein
MLNTNRVIWRFPFVINDSVMVLMPKGARVLSVEMVREQPSVYAVVDPDAPPAEVRFRLFGTGHVHSPTDFPSTFVGTFQIPEAALVFHLFQEEAPDARP